MNSGLQMNPGYLLQQLGYSGPSLLIYVFAVFMSVVYMSRAKTPCTLALIGALISIVATIGIIAFQTYVLSSAEPNLRASMQTIALLGSCLRSVGLAFLVSAIFVGRNTPPSNERYLRE